MLHLKNVDELPFAIWDLPQEAINHIHHASSSAILCHKFDFHISHFPFHIKLKRNLMLRWLGTVFISVMSVITLAVRLKYIHYCG